MLSVLDGMSSSVDVINFAVPGAPNIPEADIEDGFMSMTRFIGV